MIIFCSRAYMRSMMTAWIVVGRIDSSLWYHYLNHVFHWPTLNVLQYDIIVLSIIQDLYDLPPFGPFTARWYSLAPVALIGHMKVRWTKLCNQCAGPICSCRFAAVNEPQGFNGRFFHEQSPVSAAPKNPDDLAFRGCICHELVLSLVIVCHYKLLTTNSIFNPDILTAFAFISHY